MRNNKQIGTEFEREMCEYLKDHGYWVHFLSPDSRGAQPFDIIAVKNNIPLVLDCKTCVNHIFSISRLEDNQIMAFEYWQKCGNNNPCVAIKHGNKAYLITYSFLKEHEKVDLRKWNCFLLEDFR